MAKSDQQKMPIIGNWKMYKTAEESVTYLDELLPSVNGTSCDLRLAVPFTSIEGVAKKAEGSLLEIGAQNMNDASEGAFTGEVSASMLKAAGAQFVILGHSERRRLFNEDNAFINKKVRRALEEGLQVVLCVGETKEQREAGETEAVLEKQLTACLKEVPKESFSSLIVAYEPVWAIGAHSSATPEIAEETHTFCRRLLEKLTGQRVPLLYGGSVNLTNALKLVEQKDVDGLLIGGASLSAELFAQIIHSVSQGR